MKNYLLKTVFLLAFALLVVGCGGPGNFSGGGQACLGPLANPTSADSQGNVGCPEGIPASISLNLVSQDRNKDGLLDSSDNFTGHLNLQSPKGEKLQSRVFFGAVCGADCLVAPEVAGIVNSDLKALPANAGSRFTALALNPSAQKFLRENPKSGFAWLFSAYDASGKNPAKCLSADEPNDNCRLMLTLAFDGGDFGPGVGDGFITITEDLGVFGGVITKGNLSINSQVSPR